MWPQYRLASKSYIYSESITCILEFSEQVDSIFTEQLPKVQHSLTVSGYGATENAAYINALENMPKISTNFISKQLPLPTDRDASPDDESDVEASEDDEPDVENASELLTTWSYLNQDLEQIAETRKSIELKN